MEGKMESQLLRESNSQGRSDAHAAAVDDGGAEGRSRVSVLSAAGFREPTRNIAAFWLLGLVNNASYVIMNAGAKDIASGGVGLVYLANILPTMLVKATAPYWFDRVSYGSRMVGAAVLMSLSFVVVGFGTDLPTKLAGVALASTQSGLGEATLLALTTRFSDRKGLLTAWSSGTGMAGVFGYFWVVAFHTWLGVSFTTTLMVANVLTVGFLASFFALLQPVPRHADVVVEVEVDAVAESSPGHLPGGRRVSDNENEAAHVPTSAGERLRLMASLWPFTVPLFVVYASEYTLQAGVWAAMGFPVHSESARKTFYEYSNWCYQGGVFVSRSSGTLWTPGVHVLWVMPVLQFLMLVFFSFDAVHHFWYDYSILALCFAVGLLGGAVYVNAFRLIGETVEGARRKEIAMSGASVADTAGIALADGMSVVVQACLYSRNHISGATINVC